MSSLDPDLLASLNALREHTPVAELDQRDAHTRDLVTRWGIAGDDAIAAAIAGMSIAAGLTFAHNVCPCYLTNIRVIQAALVGLLATEPPR